MNVTAQVLNFRAALIALVPSFERAGIAWKRPDAYDQWDTCAAAIYEALVVEPLRAAIAPNEGAGFRLPPYDMLLTSYVGLHVIDVVRPTLCAVGVLCALGTAQTPFDLVEVRAMIEGGTPHTDDLTEVPIDGTEFALRRLGA